MQLFELIFIFFYVFTEIHCDPAELAHVFSILFNPLTVIPISENSRESALSKLKLLLFMNTFEYRPKVGFFLRTISRLLQK